MDGALYEFDGVGIEALPFTADTLLSSSFKFSDDSVVVGGKETITYGVSSKTGKVSVALLQNVFLGWLFPISTPIPWPRQTPTQCIHIVIECEHLSKVTFKPLLN